MRRQLTTSLPRRARLVDASGREYEVPDALVSRQAIQMPDVA